MSCSSEKLRDFYFGELGEAEGANVRGHLAGCRSCREELERLRLTEATLKALPDEEPPRRTAFVSDRVFEPRWWQRLWHTGPRLAFASAGILSLAIVFHAVYRPAPAAPATSAVQPVSQAAIDARIDSEVGRRVQAAVAAAEERQSRKAAELIEAARRDLEFQRRADRVAVEEALTYLHKKYGVLYRLSANLEGEVRP